MKSKDTAPNDTKWPTAEILVSGTFGTHTEAERRYKLRANVLNAIIWCWISIAFAYHRHPFPGMLVITHLLPAPMLTYIAWEKRKYFLSLDELSRRIELEGMAWAYSLGVLAAIWAGCICYAVSTKWPLGSSLISWTPCFLFAMFLAIVKGAYRYFATRKY